MKKYLVVFVAMILSVLIGCQTTIPHEIKNAMDNIQVPSSVSADFSLLGKHENVSITYESDSGSLKIGALNNDSYPVTITRTNADVNVKLTASFASNGSSHTKLYNVTILKNDDSAVNLENFTLTTKFYDYDEIYASSIYRIAGDDADILDSETDVGHIYTYHERGTKAYYYEEGELISSEAGLKYSETMKDLTATFSGGNVISDLKRLGNVTESNGVYSLNISLNDYYKALYNYDAANAYDYLDAKYKALIPDFSLDALFARIDSLPVNATFNDLIDLIYSYIPKQILYIFYSIELVEVLAFVNPNIDYNELVSESYYSEHPLEALSYLYGDDTLNSYNSYYGSAVRAILKGATVYDLTSTDADTFDDYYGEAKYIETASTTVSLKLDNNNILKELNIRDEATISDDGYDNGYTSWKYKDTYIVSNLGNTILADISKLLKTDFELTFETVGKILTGNLYGDVSVPVNGTNGLEISYVSTNTTALTFSEKSGDMYAIPNRTTMAVTVTVEVTVTNSSTGESQKESFTVTVPKESETAVNVNYTPNPNHDKTTLYQDVFMKDWEYTGLPTVSKNNPDEVVTQNILIVPIQFSGSKFKSTILTDIETAFFGTEAETGWESVKTYYEKSSYGKIIFDGDILPVYEALNTASWYENKYGDDLDQYLINEIIDHYDSSVDFSQYDTNGDEIIDGIYMIYSVDANYDPEVESQFWAWCSSYYLDEYYNNDIDGVYPGYYVWASQSFMYDAIMEYSEGDAEYVNINASTFIHETGHMFGLDDYYDYDDEEGPDGGLGGYDMMDYNFGDHNSFSKIMLGWTVPHIVTSSSIITIKPFESSGEVLLIPAGTWNNSYYSEYLLIEHYTPTGLNEFHADGNYLFTVPGLKIFHVSAKIGGEDSDGYWYMHANDNSFTANMLIKYVEADNDNSIARTGWAEDSDLFQTGKVLANHNWYNLYNGSKAANFTVTVVSMDSNGAKIQVDFV